MIFKKIILILMLFKIPFYSFVYILRIAIKKINFNYSFKTYSFSRDYPNYLFNGNAVKFVKPLIDKYCMGSSGLDIGGSIYSFKGRLIEDNEIENAYQILEKNLSQDFIISSHTLEHLEDYLIALKEWNRVLKKNGIILLYLPHPACDIWNKNVLRFHNWNPDPYSLEKLFVEKFKYKIEYITYLPDGYMSFCIVLRK